MFQGIQLDEFRKWSSGQNRILSEFLFDSSKFKQYNAHNFNL